MIIATVTTKDITGIHEIAVEVVDAFTAGDGRKIAVVEALNGKKPFTEYTMGGPCQTSTTHVAAHLLKNIAVSVELPAIQTVKIGESV